MSKELRIVFMGTPDFAVASLKALVEAGKNIVGVITAPDKPAGRGMQIQQSAVKEYAVQQGLNVLQPEKLKDPVFIETLKSLQADVQVVVAFRMLPEIVWSMPPMGTFNLHGSLLPQYRGAAPIHWAVINGEKETGVTTFFLKHEIDTGNIILQEKTLIGQSETTGELYERLMNIGSKLVLKTIEMIEINEVKTFPQSLASELKHAPKIYKEMCRIDWSKDVNSIHNFVRGLNPFPGAFTIADEKILKVHEVKPIVIESISVREDTNRGEESTDTAVVRGDTNHQPEVLIENQQIKIKAANGFIELLQIQPEGKKKMTAAEFLKGNTIKIIS
jgi:methionyl-tRNA formyltransferase